MATFLGKLRGRRLLLVIALLAIVIFLFLQIFSFKVLSRGARGLGRGRFPSGLAEVEDSLAKSIAELKNGYQKLIGSKIQRTRQLALVKLTRTTGVKPSLRHLYVADSEGMFTCLKTKEKVLFSKVNDDYCDCKDSSDEPGTAACSHDTNTRFYCSFQVSETEPLVISTTRVNDGICDCCDGSDEWGDARVPPQSKVKDSAQRRFWDVYAPCYDLCDELRESKLRRQMMIAEGRRIKQTYIEYGADKPNPNQMYGENGEFYKLESLCLDYTAGEFEYNICPFQSVHQQVFPKASKILGRSPVWVSRGSHGVWQLRLEDGDRDLCPGGVHREVVIEFHCGTKDEVVQLNEQEKCRYQVLMRTPAVC
ncbi:glucosidase 2 subunit beta-like [Liolophura sinensis]|uniref:glucosidase 2 subunit beta-like n=1 Tax=Liolophura sinensis TaxID=3198878 RepID=UPI003158561D